MLHADADLPVAVEGPVEAHDVRRVALVQHLQLADDLVPDRGLDLQVDELKPWKPSPARASAAKHVTGRRASRTRHSKRVPWRFYRISTIGSISVRRE